VTQLRLISPPPTPRRLCRVGECRIGAGGADQDREHRERPSARGRALPRFAGVPAHACPDTAREQPFPSGSRDPADVRWIGCETRCVCADLV